jgi:hypothetical protein
VIRKKALGALLVSWTAVIRKKSCWGFAGDRACFLTRGHGRDARGARARDAPERWAGRAGLRARDARVDCERASKGMCGGLRARDARAVLQG